MCALLVAGWRGTTREWYVWRARVRGKAHKRACQPKLSTQSLYDKVRITFRRSQYALVVLASRDQVTVNRLVARRTRTLCIE